MRHQAPSGVKAPETITIPFTLAAAIAGALSKSLVARASLLSFQSKALAAALTADDDRRNAFLEKTIERAPGAIHAASNAIRKTRKVESDLVDVLTKAFADANGGEVKGKGRFSVARQPNALPAFESFLETAFAATSTDAIVATALDTLRLKALPAIADRLEYLAANLTEHGCAAFAHHWNESRDLLGRQNGDALIGMRTRLQTIYGRRCEVVRTELADIDEEMQANPSPSVAVALAEVRACVRAHAAAIGIDLDGPSEVRFAA